MFKCTATDEERQALDRRYAIQRYCLEGNGAIIDEKTVQARSLAEVNVTSMAGG